MSNISDTTLNIISRLRTEYKGVKLLALGQTIYWDEPMKAILRRLLDEHLPEAVMVVGIHDADYFSKVPANIGLPEGWAILSHNDGSTKDLWVATGEISQLFGSETIPSRDLLTAHGVQVDKIARDFPGGRDSLADTATEAWGWRGLIHVDSNSEVACCISLNDALPHLLQLLEWGFNHTLDSLSDQDALRGRTIVNELLAEVREYASSHPDATIPDMFCELLANFYGRLLGYKPANLELSRASEIFRFNSAVVSEPRFNLLRAFLNPETREKCQESYDLAVQGSDAYTLDRFPEGAIPFDLVVPGVGRGTVCLRDGRVVIDMNDPIYIRTDKPITTPEELAVLVEDRFGSNIALVGKAVTLVLMMSSEFIFILNEQASSYVPRCEKMAELMKERGIDLNFYPILRLDYHTWDALSETDTTFLLPGHLASAMRQGEITCTEFADSWLSTLHEQEQLLSRIASISNTDELLAFLAEIQKEPWNSRLDAYRTATDVIKNLSEKTEPLKTDSVRLRDLNYQTKQDIQQLEVAKGEHFRSTIKPLKDRIWELECDGITSGSEYDQVKAEMAEHEIVRAEFEQKITDKRELASKSMSRSLEIKNEVRLLEKGEDAEKARQSLKRIEYEAELARMWLVRDAILVSKGLDYTDHRPSAWWFLLVDPELKWFNKVAETTEFHFEEINPSV
ncbi:MAG: hypothetical protein ACYC27_20110 [Armatimonadota bacterium]